MLNRSVKLQDLINNHIPMKEKLLYESNFFGIESKNFSYICAL